MSTMVMHAGYPVDDPHHLAPTHHSHPLVQPHPQQLPPPPLLYGPLSQHPPPSHYNPNVPPPGPSHHHHSHSNNHPHPQSLSHSHSHTSHNPQHPPPPPQSHHPHPQHHHSQQPSQVPPQSSYQQANGANPQNVPNDRMKVMRANPSASSSYAPMDSSEPESIAMNGASSSRKERKRRPTNAPGSNHQTALERERDRTRLHRLYLDQRDAFTAAAQSLQAAPQNDPSYVLRLYPVSLERSAWLNSIETEESWALESAGHTWNEERAKIEEEYKKGKERARDRLLEGIEERRKRAREEKDNEGIPADVPPFEAQVPARPVKKPAKPAPFVLAALHPFGAAGEELVSPFPLPLTAFAGSTSWANGKRRQKGVGQTGGLTLGKAISNLGGLKESEIEYDMGEIKKGVKRKRARAGAY